MEQEFIDDIVDKYEEAIKKNKIYADFDNFYESSDDDDE